MFENLIEKLRYEYDRYCAYLMLISKPDCIERAYEITVKMCIYERLLDESDKLSDELTAQFMNIDDIVDFIFLKGGKFLVIKNREITAESWKYVLSAVRF